MHEFGRESDVVEILVKLEKVAAEASLLRELFIQKDERFSHMLSELGELRAMVIKAERENQENAMKIDKLDSILKTLDPVEIEKTLAMKEKMIVEAQARLEKVEKMLEDLRNNFLQHVAKIDKLGNFESISKVYKDMSEVLSNIKRKEDNINLTAGKVETTFFEMEKRLKEFEKSRPLIERMEDLSNEMIKSLGDVNIKMSNFPTRDELEEFRKGIREKMKSAVEGLEEQRSKAAGEIDAVRQDLERQKAVLEERLSRISGSVDALRQQGLGSVDRSNELAASMARLENEAHNLALQLDAYSQKSMKSEGRLATFEERLKGINDSFGVMSEKLKAVEESIKSEEIEAINATLAGLGSRIEQLSIKAQTVREAQDTVRQDLERQKAVLEERLSRISGSVDALRQQGLGSVDRSNELAASMARLENEAHNLALQLDAYSQKSMKSEGRLATFEERLKGINDSFGVMSEKLKAVEESIRTQVVNVKNMEKQFEDKINVRVLELKGEYEAIKKHLPDASVYSKISRLIGKRKE